MTTTTSRRALIKSAPLAAAALAIPMSARAATADRTAWNVAMAAYNAAKAEDDAYNPVFRELHNRWTETTEAVPHVTLRPDPYTGRFEPVSTADRFFVADARRIVKELAEGKRRHDPLPDLTEHTALLHEVVAAADKRDTEIDAISGQLGYDAASERYEALGEALYGTEDALMETPAPDLAALRWKLAKVIDSDGTNAISAWSAEYVAQTIADIARLLPEGR